MKSNKVTIISSLFLMTALCGCTTQSVDKAKEIEESNTYVYKYGIASLFPDNGDVSDVDGGMWRYSLSSVLQ